MPEGREKKVTPPQKQMTKHRVSFINFLNSVPLGWNFLQGKAKEDFEILFDVPSECAAHLAGGQADVGLIPVIEYQRIPGLKVLPGISISAKREVRSVLFVSRLPLEKVKTVGLDTSSRTSAALLKILLKVFYGRDSIGFEPHPPHPAEMLQKFDAALLIGNPALHLPSEKLYTYDLAREWRRFTGLPFVFAFWAVRGEVELGERVSHFYDSRRQGLAHVDLIAETYSERLGLRADEIKTYLRLHLDYSLDEENLKGLTTFFELARQEDLIDSIDPIRFYPVPSRFRERPASQTRS